jgi:hypothetical protein
MTPDLESMDRLAALVWLNQHTYACGAGTRPLPAALAALRDSLIAAGWTATSPDVLDPEAEQLARQERQT